MRHGTAEVHGGYWIVFLTSSSTPTRTQGRRIVRASCACSMTYAMPYPPLSKRTKPTTSVIETVSCHVHKTAAFCSNCLFPDIVPQVRDNNHVDTIPSPRLCQPFPPGMHHSRHRCSIYARLQPGRSALYLIVYPTRRIKGNTERLKCTASALTVVTGSRTPGIHQLHTQTFNATTNTPSTLSHATHWD